MSNANTGDSDFISQMNFLRSRLTPLIAAKRVSNIRNLIVRKKIERGHYEYLEINPKPQILDQTPTKANFDSISGVKLLTADYKVKGVSRNYTSEQLFGDGIDYIVDGEMRLGALVSGVICKFVSQNENALTWDVSLARKIGEQNLFT